jgi:hypothetical protein
MLPLINPGFPNTAPELQTALTNGLAEIFTGLPSVSPVRIQASQYPVVERLLIDVTGATVRSDYPFQRPEGTERPGVTVEQLELVGRPVCYQQGAITVEISGRDVRMDVVVDANGGSWLVPADARSGHIRSEVTHANLEALMRSALQAGADQYDLTVEKAELTLTSEGERSARLEMRVTGKKQLAFAPIRAVLRGEVRLVIDDTLTATLHDITVDGEGVIGAMVAGLVRGEVQQWEGHSFPLTTFSLGNLKLHNVTIACQDGLQVEAVFGN